LNRHDLTVNIIGQPVVLNRDINVFIREEAMRGPGQQDDTLFAMLQMMTEAEIAELENPIRHMPVPGAHGNNNQGVLRLLENARRALEHVFHSIFANVNVRDILLAIVLYREHRMTVQLRQENIALRLRQQQTANILEQNRRRIRDLEMENRVNRIDPNDPNDPSGTQSQDYWSSIGPSRRFDE
jgi:hypothetical protein